MAEIEAKYGFPLFSRPANNVYLGNGKKLIISDIWAFWDYILKKRNYEREFMGSLLEQAKTFYMAAETSPIKSKPLLYYYSFLNFAKIIINMERQYGRAQYMHGLSETHNNSFSSSTITIAPKKIHIKNVSAEFLEVLDGTTTGAALTLNVRDYLSHCVGIHRAYSEIYGQPEIFIRIENPTLYKQGQNLVSKAKVFCDASNLPLLTARGYNVILEDGVYYWEETVANGSYNITRQSYCRIANHLRNKGIWYYIGNKGYTQYLSTQPGIRHAPEVIIYNSMFFLGSITRYHPYMFDRIFSDRDQWLMSEFLTTQPKQFLFLCTAKILGQSVLKAYTSF